ncbi:MAG: SCO family protein, partial [Rhodocyclaceae bacterium]|nr:SCO family protein [Rhodocyclaceae bacterium]
RDTPAMLREYAAFFHPEMVGLTGTPAEIAAVARSFGAGYLRQPLRPDGGYAVDHTANTYVVGPDGQLAETLPPGADPDQVLAALRRRL